MLVETIAEIEFCGSPTWARSRDLRIDMASGVKRAREFLPSKHHARRAGPIGEATGSSMTTVDQTDMRALVSRKTVVRHGAASL
jgi:ssDNA-binding replication factor A large subunit